MFSFRRKNAKKSIDIPRIRTSPSLPELSSPGIPWPEDLVDVAAIREEPSADEAPQQGAAKTSFQGIDHTTIPFHKPFRTSPGKLHGGETISSLYMSSPPPAFDNRRAPTPTSVSWYNQRRARIPPTFNLMVVGGKGTGKTSLLRLLLETADISPTATVDQQTAMDRFLQGATKHTQSIQTACVEICESRFDRLLFSVIDTPGLDFAEGRQLRLERQVNGIIKYLDSLYADTMSEESKVIRKSKGDQHVHLCIYMIDPSSIMTTAARRALSALPTKTRSEITISYRPPDLVPDTSSTEDSDDESATLLTMSPAEIRVIRRLCARSNVLPVIGRADSLTDAKLAAVKDAVRKGLQDASLDFGVFGSPTLTEEVETPKIASRGVSFDGDEIANGNGHVEGSDEDDEEEEERPSRTVIKLRSTRHRNLSRSRSRRDLSEAARDEHVPVSPDANDRESVANVRFSAHIIAKTDLGNLMPFALIAPEDGKRRPRPMSFSSQDTATHPSSPMSDSTGEGRLRSSISAHSVKNSVAYLQGPPDDLKGVFTRKFRWGTVDVLDPNHCDFAALRTAVLSTHLKLLKTHTKEILYEKYRTEKLLARRATRHITDEERKRLLEDLGL